MLRQVRKAMSNIEHGQIFEAIVEIDETYVGGKPTKKNRKDDNDKNIQSIQELLKKESEGHLEDFTFMIGKINACMG